MRAGRPGYRLGGVTGKGFMPGRSGNPGGRPRGRTLTGVLRELLEQEHNGRPIMEVLAERILKGALTGKFPFAKELWDSVEGRPTERHEVTDGNTVRIMVADARGHEREASADELRALMAPPGVAGPLVLAPPPVERVAP